MNIRDKITYLTSVVVATTTTRLTNISQRKIEIIQDSFNLNDYRDYKITLYIFVYLEVGMRYIAHG